MFRISMSEISGCSGDDISCVAEVRRLDRPADDAADDVAVRTTVRYARPWISSVRFANDIGVARSGAPMKIEGTIIGFQQRHIWNALEKHFDAIAPVAT
jgi:hypothetical protein